MRADASSRFVSATRTVFATAFALVIAVGVSACKTEKDSDQPTILGAPAPVAYLGVEYSYNFGAYGGDSILDYSLTNAPAWLALEGTSNKARQGIIMRGVPGLTGGDRGIADLGKHTGISLVTTDGKRAGVQPFDIEVKRNALSLEADRLQEGVSPTIPETRREQCTLPDLETAGKHTFTINEYDDAGNVTGTTDITAETHPVAVRVILDQPSTTTVQVAFELTSAYDPDKCNPSSGVTSGPHQQCDFSDVNVGHAIIGQDIVALGNNSNNDKLLEDLVYLSYEKDGADVYQSGVVTFKPGITECFIRLEVIDDTFAEQSEVAQLTLTEVREGLASLGGNNSGVGTKIIIDDDEPVITLKTKAGGIRDALNVGGVQEYVAVLTGARKVPFKAKLGHTDNSTARLNTEFVIERKENNSWVESDELMFPVGTNEVPFQIRVKDNSSGYFNPGMNDRLILLGLNEEYQRGRDKYARAANENLLRVSINEQTSPLVLGSASDKFVPTDFVIGHEGRVFVVGYDSDIGDQILVRIYDQKGDLVQDARLSDASDQLDKPSPVINVIQRKVSLGNTKIDRFEFVVAYSTAMPVAGTAPENGGQDVIVTRYWFDSATNGGEYVPDWIIRTGTAADDDVRSVVMNPDTGFVVIAGETKGAWPDQTLAGGTDSFLQQIKTKEDPQGSGDFVGEVDWTQQVGSQGDDSVAGVSTATNAPILFGHSPNSVHGAPALGGQDAYFYSTSGNAENLKVYQVGTEKNEEVTNGVYGVNVLWLLGNSAADYSVVENDGDADSLKSSTLNSLAGFLLGYSVTGDIKRAFTLNDADDLATEHFGAVSEFNGDLVAAGSSDGSFSGNVAVTSAQAQAIVARVSLAPEADDQENPLFRNEWRYQLNTDDSEILVLSNYRDDEISALARIGRQWSLLLFSPEGELLTQ